MPQSACHHTGLVLNNQPNSAPLYSVIFSPFLAMFCGGVHRKFVHAPRSQRQIYAVERADGNRRPDIAGVDALFDSGL